MHRIRVLIADSQPFFYRGVSQVLNQEEDLTVVGTTALGSEVATLVADLRPDVVLIDMQLPGFGGFLAIERLARQYKEVRVIVLASEDEPVKALAALRAGAWAYLCKKSSEVQVIETVRAVYRNEVLLDAHLTAEVLQEFRRLCAVRV